MPIHAHKQKKKHKKDIKWKQEKTYTILFFKQQKKIVIKK
jgi:hypothetical protein